MLLIKRYKRQIIGFFAVITFVAVLAINALLVWVATGPRSLDRLTPYIEASFNEGSEYSVKVGETWLLWDGWRHPIDIRLRNVSVLSAQGQTFSTFPEVAVELHLPSLIVGNVMLRSLSIDKPIVSLFQDSEGAISFGFKEARTAQAESASTVPFSAMLASFMDDDHGALRKLRYVIINNADVSVGSERKGVFFEARETDLVAKRNSDGVIELITNGKIQYDEYQSSIYSHFTLDKSNPDILGTLNFKGLELNKLANLFLDKDDVLIDMPISGRSNITLDSEGTLKRLQFNIDGGEGSFNSSLLQAPLPIAGVHVEGQVSNNASDIQIDKLTGVVDGIEVVADGIVELKENDAAIRINGSFKDIPASKVQALWPAELAPASREWVVNNIKEGHVSEASIKTDIKFGDLRRPQLPKESIEATINLEKGKIRYLPDHPETSGVNATIAIDAITLDAAIHSASFLTETVLSNGRLLIEDLNADNPYIKINFDAAASAKDIVTFLGLPRLKHAERLNLKADRAQGRAKGSVGVGFNFFSPRDEEGNPIGEPDVDYAVKATVENVSHPSFMKKFDIEQANGDFSIDKTTLGYIGKGRINGADAGKLDIRYLFTPKDGYDTFIDLEATASDGSLVRFGYPELEFLKGMLGVVANVRLGPKLEVMKGDIDLTNATIDAKEIMWKKEINIPASLSMTTEKKDGLTRISSFALQSNGVEAKGSIDLNSSLTGVSRVQLSKLLLGKTNLSTLDYAKTSSGIALRVFGQAVDLSGLMEGDEESDEVFSFERFPPIKFQGNVANLILKGGKRVSNFKGDLFCDVRLCQQADLNGEVGDKPFHFRILRNPKGVRQLSLHAENAGEFLKTIGVYEKMEGGDLTITGNYHETTDGSLLDARLDINEHSIKKAPVLAKILSLASLTGFIDVLEGNGIRFNKMVIPFSLQNDVITVKKARAYGSAIGITAEGTVTFPRVIFDLKGTVVPAYMANHILGNLPIIGDVLTGGDGGGVFAGSYSMKGTYSDSKVSVNPLSMLTPGFLRGIFDAGDKVTAK